MYPITFKSSSVELIIDNLIKSNYYYVEENPIQNLTNKYDLPVYSFKFSSITWFGMLIDTVVNVTACSQVF